MEIQSKIEIKCLRPGCGKKYFEECNTDTSCYFHDGKPIFHDVKKGWTCCNKTVYDWDEFTKLAGCKNGKHCPIKQEAQFFKSNTVSNAQAGIERVVVNNNVPITAPTKSIEDYEKEQKAKEEAKIKAEEEKPKILVVSFPLNFIIP